MADLTFADNDAAETATLQFLDDDGNATEPVNTPQWTASDGGAFITLDVADNGLSATATPVAPGTATVTISVVNEAGETITGQSTVIVTGGDVESLSVAWAPITPVPSTQPTDSQQTAVNVPSAPEVLTSSPSTLPGSAPLQGGTTTVEATTDDESGAVTEPQIVPADDDGNPAPLKSGSLTPTATQPAETEPVSSQTGASPEVAPLASPVDPSAGATVPDAQPASAAPTAEPVQPVADTSDDKTA